ncbi:patatin family protein [soil metagenome]
MLRKTFAAIGLMAALTLGACGTLERPTGPLRIAPDQIVPAQDPRIGANDTAKLQALVADVAGRFSGAAHGQKILALSGGGANGAYGAGLLVGWTQHGDRPSFDIVTGVSTGALAAPFAFLGPDWDDELREAYTGGGADGLLSPRMLAAFVNPSLFSSRVLRTLVDDNVTPELLRQIAIENAKGRKLLVATTNLDTEETVIWDMGVLATQGDAAALTLFKNVLVASASIPGVFPPVLIAGLNKDGQVIEDMHVDGGVNTPFLAIPEDLLLWTNPAPARVGGSIYVVVNGQIGRNEGVTPGRISGILSRTYDSMSKSSLRTMLIATSGFADRNGLSMSMAAIPDNVTASSLKFDSASMQALFELGRARSASGEAWSPVTTSRTATALPTTQAPVDQIPDALMPTPDTKNPAEDGGVSGAVASPKP